MSLLSLSPYSAELALTELLGAATHLALFTADPIAAGSLASEQPNANGYSRQAISWTSVGGPEEASSADITFEASGAAWTGPWYVCAMDSGTHGAGNVIAIAVWEAGTPNEGQPWTTFDREGINGIPDGGKLIVPLGDLIFGVGAIPDVPPLDPVAEILAMQPTLFWVFDRHEYNSVQLLFQDDAATTPVTANGQPVGCARDLVEGREAIQSTSGRRPEYVAGTGIEFDNNGELSAGDCSDVLVVTSTAPSDSDTQTASYGVGVVVNSSTSERCIIVSPGMDTWAGNVMYDTSEQNFKASATSHTGGSFADDSFLDTRIDIWQQGLFARAVTTFAQGEGLAFRNVASGMGTTNMTFGSYKVGHNGYRLDGTISYVIFFDRLLNIPELAKLQRMLLRIGQ